jgi:hypothetical protein
VREKPILFSTPMVQGILEGRKTQTRRVVKPQPPADIDKLIGPEIYEPAITDRCGELKKGKPIFGAYDEWGEYGVKSPYAPGDVLWVRETWAEDSGKYYYKASRDCGDRCGKWRPSIHMPREASRLFLAVKNVRVERVQEIGANDCQMEGVKPFTYCCDPTDLADYYRDAFRELWDATYSKRGYGWDTNPWVWVYEFERGQ